MLHIHRCFSLQGPVVVVVMMLVVLLVVVVVVQAARCDGVEVGRPPWCGGGRGVQGGARGMQP